MKATFEKTMDILVKAYLNDTLEHGNCHACVIGNLCAYSKGIGFIRGNGYKHTVFTPNINIWESGHPVWFNAFGTYIDKDGISKQYFYEEEIKLSEHDYEQTGYTLNELIEIEKAFETAPKGNNDDDWMFNGLMAVLDVLADIHGICLTVKKNYEEQLSAIYES